MIDFYFNTAYDMSLDGQDIAFTTSENYLQQNLTKRLQFILREWFLDIRVGLPYPQIIFEAKTSLEDVYSLLRQTIIDTDGVEKLDSLIITPSADERSISVVFSVNNGTTTDSIILP
jgi:hypothetical protein